MIVILTYRGQAMDEPRGTVERAGSGSARWRVRQAPMRFLAQIGWLLLPLASPAQAQGTVTTGIGSQFELAFWQSVESGNDSALYEAYLAQYPNGTFAAVARVKLAKLRQLSAPAPAAPVQMLPAPEPAPAPAPTPAPAARKQLTDTKPALAGPAPIPAPFERERLAATSPAPWPAPPASRTAVPRNDDDNASAPYVTAAPPTEPGAEAGDSDALRSLNAKPAATATALTAPAPAPPAKTAVGKGASKKAASKKAASSTAGPKKTASAATTAAAAARAALSAPGNARKSPAKPPAAKVSRRTDPYDRYLTMIGNQYGAGVTTLQQCKAFDAIVLSLSDKTNADRLLTMVSSSLVQATLLEAIINCPAGK